MVLEFKRIKRKGKYFVQVTEDIQGKRRVISNNTPWSPKPKNKFEASAKNTKREVVEVKTIPFTKKSFANEQIEVVQKLSPLRKTLQLESMQPIRNKRGFFEGEFLFKKGKRQKVLKGRSRAMILNNRSVRIKAHDQALQMAMSRLTFSPDSYQLISFRYEYFMSKGDVESIR